MPRKPSNPATETARKPALQQDELWGRFPHLQRQRAAGRLAERILRLIASVDPQTGEIALEIAITAARMKGDSEKPQAEPAPTHPGDGGLQASIRS